MPRGKPEKYLDIAKKIQQYIRVNAVADGDILPSERTLAEKYECNHLTVRKALRKLEQGGVIYKVPSIGNFVGQRPSAGTDGGIVGIILPDGDLFFYRLLMRLDAVFERLHLFPVIRWSRLSLVKEEEYLTFFQKHGARAVIAVPSDLQSEKMYEQMRCPVIFFDHQTRGTPVPCVYSDDFSGAEAAMDYLCSLGHRRIAFIGCLQSALRYRGYLSVLRKNAIEVNRKYVKLGRLTREWGMQAAAELLELDEPPTAVFCANDTVAAGVMRCCVSRKIQVPEELSVIGFSNSETAEDLFLTSVSQHSDKMAAAIAENLTLLLTGNEVQPEIIVPENVVIRNSCSSPRTATIGGRRP